MSSIQERDYYQHLFTPESDYDETINHDPAMLDAAKSQEVHDPYSDFLEQGEYILQHFFGKNSLDLEDTCIASPPAEYNAEDDDLGSDMDIDSDSMGSSISSWNFEDIDLENGNSFTNEDSLPEMINLLPENEILDLLGQKEREMLDEPKSPTLPPTTADKIGTFNIQNKFDHDTAAELFVREDMTFLALQEPFAHSKMQDESWSSFQQLEMQNARIISYFTKYQVIMFDGWRWGGKILQEFESFSHGRVTSIAFDLGNKQKIGIIRVYASTKEAIAGSSMIDHDEEEKLNMTAELICEIKGKLLHNYPDICIIVMGDMQETLTTEDSDNMGVCRYKTPPNGILRSLESSHQSIVRNLNAKTSYVTRIGREGGRGIDHILTPTNRAFSNWFVQADIHRNIGNSYFPSDHSLLICHVDRKGHNNVEGGETVRSYDYNKIFRIKLARTGPNNDELNLNGSQFKDCDRFREQKELYDKIQKLTGDTSDTTDYLIGDIEKRTNILFKRLWYEGVMQDVNGKENKLVQINDSHAVEIAHIVRRFNIGIKDVMQTLSLVKDSCQNDTAANIRGRLRKRKGFKHFDNLPITTKLRYLRSAIQKKVRAAKQALQWLREKNLRAKLNQNDSPWSEFIQILIRLKDTKEIYVQSKMLYEEAMHDASEREDHVKAVNTSNESRHTNSKGDENGTQYVYASNDLPFVPDIIVDKINVWLKEANCDQLFGANQANDKFGTLLNCVSPWKDVVEKINIEHKDMESEKFKINAVENLEKCLTLMNGISTKICKTQRFYKQATLQYFLDTNQISNFTRKMLPQSRSAPATHTKIWDPALDDFRQCKNEQEELAATKEFHGRWMGNSAATEVCAFAKIMTEGKLGQRGISLSPDRIVTEKDIETLVHNGNKLPARIKKAFVKAHGLHTRKLFRLPECDHRELHYPFYLQDNKGKMHEAASVEESFWKAIASVPSKARHDGFQLAVIGRFGKRWQTQLLNIIKLLLIMRYVPESLKVIARYPIPKPGKTNEYRPISLCNDLYCFLNGVITKFSSDGIERARILHEGIVAYRRGRGCHSLVTIEQCFREDCVAGPWPVVQLDEDEEKFFDRVSVEILLAAMRVNGFPAQGYVEFKASAMSPKLVEIITSKGRAFAKFVCGLEQGNPDSPTIANLVIKFKHDIWDAVSDEIRKIFGNQKEFNDEKYKFHIVDQIDGKVMLCKIGYCDDNSKFIRVENEKDLVRLVEYYLQLAGDLSMVTKIGRKGAKCDIQFYNLSAEMTIKLRKCMSIAWSFKHDAPVEEEVPFRVYLKRKEYEKLKILIDYDKLGEEEKLGWDKIINSEAHRHLGMIGKMSGSTTETSNHFINKMENRLHQLKIGNMKIEPQRKCINMLVNTIHSYIPLQANHSVTRLAKFDGVVAEVIRKANGITASDCKHRIFLPLEEGGLGISSALEIDVISVCRELEIVSNSTSLDAFAFRTRIADAKNNGKDGNEDNQWFNHAKEAINKLGRYGVHLRDNCDGLVNDILNHFNTLSKFVSIGHPKYKDGTNGHSIGNGKEQNLNLAFGGAIHKCALLLQQNNWTVSKEISEKDRSSEIKFADMLGILPIIKRTKMHDFNRLFSYLEWLNEDNSPHYTVPDEKCKWRPIQPIEFNEENIFSKIDWKNAEKSIFQIVRRRMKMFDTADIFQPTHLDHLAIRPTIKYATQFNYMITSMSPIIFATDGALQQLQPNKEKAASSALVMCSLDIRLGESIESGEWINRPVIPMLSRCSILPRRIGIEETDIASAECHAMLMTELSIPSFLPRIYITDSEAVRDQVIQARENSEGEINRSFIRSIVGGIGKCIMGTMAKMISQETIEEEINKAILQNQLTEELVNIFKERNTKFLKIAQSWTTITSGTSNPFNTSQQEKFSNERGKNNNEPMPWRKDYFDSNILRSFLKVNSHQLNAEGLQILKKPRYSKLIPNLCMLNANHLADKIADLPLTRTFAASHLCTYDIRNPISPLRFTITLNGQSIDKHISTTLKRTFINERIKKIKTKDTQGLLWRVIDSSDMTWKEICTHKGYLRSLLGLSKTHSRSIYKNINYKQGCKLELIESIVGDEDKNRIKNMKPKELTSLLTRCTWCPSTCPHNQHHGNRLHALLHCEHDDLKKFRTNMRKVINDEICNMVRLLEKYTSTSNATTFIEEISGTYLQLQLSQKGRLKRIQPHLNHAYASLKELKEKFGESNTFDCIMSRSHSAAIELFGLVPQHTIAFDSDAKIGVADITWLGLMPKSVCDVVEKHENIIRAMVKHMANREEILETFSDKWKLIKGLTMGLAAGLHKVIGTISKTILGELQKKHNLDAYTITALKKKVKRNHPLKQTSLDKSMHTGICKQCTKGDLQTKARIQFTMNCPGITCAGNKSKWAIFQNFRTNKIPSGKKHCLRCTRHSSAIRTAAATLITFNEGSTDTDKKKFKQMIVTTSPSNPCYFQFMHLLQRHLPTDKQRVRTKYTNKSRISDTHKTMCRVIMQVHTIERASSHWQADRIIDLPKTLKEILQNSESNINVQQVRKKDAAKKAQQIIQRSEITGKEIDLITDDELEENLKRKASDLENITRKEQKAHYLRETLLVNGYISSMAIRRAIEVFRHENQNELFFANPEAGSILECWIPSQGWKRAARIFASHRAICRKPDGMYFIPIFEGQEAAGHWFLVIVHKQGRYRRGYVMDSLGNANLNLPILKKIKDLFKSAEGSFAWNSTTCHPQTEVECGPRTIMHIAYMIEEIRKGNEIGECLAKASLIETEERDYSAIRIREQAAEIIEKYKVHMWTHPIPIGRNQEFEETGEEGRCTKRRRRRRKKSKSSLRIINSE